MRLAAASQKNLADCDSSLGGHVVTSCGRLYPSVHVQYRRFFIIVPANLYLSCEQCRLAKRNCNGHTHTTTQADVTHNGRLC